MGPRIGLLTSPIGLTNTHSVGVVRDAMIAVRGARARAAAGHFWSLPVVGETWDGPLTDVTASTSPAPRGSGRSPRRRRHGRRGRRRRRHRHDLSRVQGRHRDRLPRASDDGGSYTVGVLVQANHGRRDRLTVDGAPGRAASSAGTRSLCPPIPSDPGGGPAPARSSSSSRPMPHFCRAVHALAQRAGLGVARTGGAGEHSERRPVPLLRHRQSRHDRRASRAQPGRSTVPVQMLLGRLHHARSSTRVVEATEEGDPSTRCVGAEHDDRSGRDHRSPLPGERPSRCSTNIGSPADRWSAPAGHDVDAAGRTLAGMALAPATRGVRGFHDTTGRR